MFNIKTTKKYGRGLYASRNIKKGEIVEISPVLLITKDEAIKISDTLINVYVFEWGKFDSALAFGHGSLFNHSRNANMVYMSNFQTKEIVFMSNKSIKKGEQLFINYGYEPEYGIQLTKRNKEQGIGRHDKHKELETSCDGILGRPYNKGDVEYKGMIEAKEMKQC